MKFFEKKRTLVLGGIATFTLAMAAFNYSHLLENGAAPNLIRVENAQASDTPCYSQASTTCYFTTPDGLSHSTSNAEHE